MRDFLRGARVAACGLPAVLLTTVLFATASFVTVLFTAAPAMASDAGPQRSATPNVTAEIGYTRAQVHPGDQDTMTVSLVNHGPQSLDDNTSVHVTVTMPQDTEVSPTVVETIPGNAPAGSSNAVPSTRSVPLTQVFVRSAPGFFDVVVPAGSFGDSTSFRTYGFTLHVSPSAPQGTQLVGGGVAVALENYVGLTVAKSIVPPAPVVVVVPKSPGKSHESGRSGSKSGGSGGKSGGSGGSGTPGTSGGSGAGGAGASGAGSSEWVQRWGGGSSTGTGTGCSGSTGSGGKASGGSGSGGSGQCGCPVNPQMSVPTGGTGGSGNNGSGNGGNSNSGGAGGNSGSGNGAPCPVGKLAATGTASTWPLAVGLLALAGGVALMRVAQRRNWSRP